MCIIEEINFKKSYNRIKKIINCAFETKYYANIFEKSGIFRNNDFNIHHFKNIPIMNKLEYRECIFDMISTKFNTFDSDFYKTINDFAQKRSYLEGMGLAYRITSGSTGTPLEIIKSQNDIKLDYISLQYYRSKMVNYRFGGKYLWIWPVNPVTRHMLYPNDKCETIIPINKYGFQYMLYEHSEEHFNEIYKFIIEKEIEWLTVSPSVVVSFVDFLINNNLSLCQIKYIECHSEKLHEWQKNKIVNFLNCEVKSIYSSNEVQFIAGECAHGSFHVFTNSCFVEIEKNDNVSEILITSLMYKDIPIIRYRLGDWADWDEESDNCCNLAEFPKIKLLGVRTNDFFISKSGKNIEPFVITDSIIFLENMFGIQMNKYKVCQLSVDLIEYYLEMNVSCKGQVESFLEKYYSNIFGYSITVHVVDCIDFNKFTYNGNKFKYIERLI